MLATAGCCPGGQVGLISRSSSVRSGDPLLASDLPTRYSRAVDTSKKRPWDRPPITEEQRVEFLKHTADGRTRQEAAEAVGSTGSRMRGLIGRDPEFAQAYLDALEASGNPENPLNIKIESAERTRMLERLLDEYIMRALDSERGKSGSSNRALSNLLTLLHDSFKPFLEARTRHIHEGAVGVYALPQIDTDKWTLEQHQEFVSLRKRMNELLVLARPENAPSLTPIEMTSTSTSTASAEVIIDAEFTDESEEEDGGAGVREPREPLAPRGGSSIRLDVPVTE